MQGVEDGQVAFAGHAECRVDAVHDELIDQNLPAGPHLGESGWSKKTVGRCQFGLSSSAGST